jgi:long-chain acyl-CoA synthetase
VRARTSAPGLHETDTLWSLLSKSAARFGEATALQVCRSGQWTRLSYTALLALSRQWGGALAAAGVKPGDRVFLIAESCSEWGIAYFAALSRGAAVVPLDPHLTPADIGALADRTKARVWLVSRTVKEQLTETQRTRPDLTLFDLTAFTAPPPEATPANTPVPPAAPDEIASILFTSGTTLAPKGVPLSHRNFMTNVDALLTVVPFHQGDRLVSVLPLQHALEFTGGLLAPLRVGAAITYLEKLTPKGLLEALQTTQATTMIGVPRLCALLARALETGLSSRRGWSRLLLLLIMALARMSRASARLLPPLASSQRALRRALFTPLHRRLGGRFKLIVTGGAALPPEIYDSLDLYGFTICEGYGLTETAPVLTVNPPSRPRRGTVGPPIPGTEIRLAEADAEGVGPVLARGPGVFSGYLDNPEATAAVFDGEWFRTGDLGRLEPDGYLVLAGREDDVIVTGGGKNVYPIELEWLYQHLPYVKELCVVGVPDTVSAGDAVHLVVVEEESEEGPSGPERRAAIEAAVSEIGRRLPPHQRLRGVHYWPGDLPRTSTLKIKRRQVQTTLREQLARE